MSAATYTAAASIDEALQAMRPARGRSPAAPTWWSARAAARRRCRTRWSRSTACRRAARQRRGRRRAGAGRARDPRRHRRQRRRAGRFTALADASAIVGSHATRNVGTIGGNVMNASPAMETGGPLICFEATVDAALGGGTAGGGGRPVRRPRHAPTAERRRTADRVHVPAPAAGTGSCYVRLEYRRQMEIAIVGATAVVTLDGGTVSDARIAITALAPTIHRVAEAEAALDGSDGGEASPCTRRRTRRRRHRGRSRTCAVRPTTAGRWRP